MSLKVSQQIIYWSAGLVALIAFVWLLGGTLMPFLVGMGIAYFLDPLVDKLEALRLPRAIATAFISIGAVLIIVLALLTLLPELQRQIVNLITALPDYFAIAQTLLNENLPNLAKESPLLERGIAQITARLESSGDDLIGVILSSAFGIIDILIFMVVTPVVAFYMLLDWDNMVAKIDSWLPARSPRRYSRACAGNGPSIGGVCPWATQRLRDFGRVLCGYAGSGRVAIRAGRWAGRGVAQLYSLCRRDNRRSAGNWASVVSILGRATMDYRCCRDFCHWTNGGGQYIDPKTGRRVGWLASCLADVFAVCLWGVGGFYWAIAGCAYGGMYRCGFPLCHRAVFARSFVSRRGFQGQGGEEKAACR